MGIHVTTGAHRFFSFLITQEQREKQKNEENKQLDVSKLVVLRSRHVWQGRSSVEDVQIGSTTNISTTYNWPIKSTQDRC
jgi:hypothetical protein